MKIRSCLEPVVSCCLGRRKKKIRGRKVREELAELLCYYNELCRLDPELEAFQIALRKPSTVLYPISEKKTVEDLKKANFGLFSSLLEFKPEFSKDPDLVHLVALFFKSLVQLLKFLTAVRRFLKRASETKSALITALRNVHCTPCNHSIAVEKLREFRKAGNPFTYESIHGFVSLYRQQKQTLIEIYAMRQQIGQKIKSLKTWRRACSIVYGVVFAGIIASSIVFSVLAVPPVAAAAAAAIVGVNPLYKCFGSFWDEWEEKLEDKKSVIVGMGDETIFVLHELEMMRVLANRLEVLMGLPMTKEVEAVMREEGLMTVGELTRHMRIRLKKYSTKLRSLKEEVDQCSCRAKEIALEILRMIAAEV